MINLNVQSKLYITRSTPTATRQMIAHPSGHHLFTIGDNKSVRVIEHKFIK